MTSLCGCRYANLENGGGNSVAWWHVCGITGKATDPEACADCERKEVSTGNIDPLGRPCHNEVDANLSFIRGALSKNNSILDVHFYYNPNELELVVVAEQADASTYDFVSGVLTQYEDIFRHAATYVLLTPSRKICPIGGKQ